MYSLLNLSRKRLRGASASRISDNNYTRAVVDENCSGENQEIIKIYKFKSVAKNDSLLKKWVIFVRSYDVVIFIYFFNI